MVDPASTPADAFSFTTTTAEDFAAAPTPDVPGDAGADLEAKCDTLKAIIADLHQRNDALADAVVNSAEIIDELEQTKRQLAEARGAAEIAHRNSQRMAETIFEGTQDAMMVLDTEMRLVAANRNARTMFRLSSCGTGADGPESKVAASAPTEGSVVRLLQQQFSSEVHSDWFHTLTTSPLMAERIELYRPIGEADSGDVPQGSPDLSLARQWIELSVSTLESDLSGASYLLAAHDITQRKQIEEQFQHQALHDNVTRLPNRRFFVRQVEELLRDADGDTTFSICFLDLDNFKTVNDTLGHEAGDQLLVQVAERIRETTRDDSFLARFGGDEFAILCPGLSHASVAAIAERIVDVLNEPFTINENSVYIGASIGMTRYPDDGVNVESLLQNADVAMYSAKEGGRNCFHQFTPQLAGEIQERQQLMDDLRGSLERKDIALEYQPKWCLRENRFAGCEVLLRWRRNGVPVAAPHLVEVAECSGLIVPLGDLVIETATRQMAEWQDTLSPGGHIAINVSPQQFADPDFARRFRRIIERTGISPATIELEVTETAMMENFGYAFERFAELRRLGVSIAIDDFGTGYSSLSYLKSLPVSTLKIDRSFVKDLPDDTKAVAIAEAILALGRGLGLCVVAEGVETREQYQFLAGAGCDQMQGFLISHSLTPEEFSKWLVTAQERGTMLAE